MSESIKTKDDIGATPIEIGDDVMYQVLDDELIILNMSAGQYYALNRAGSDIWMRLLQHHSPDAVVAQICATREVDRETAQRDFERFVSDLTRLELLKA